MNFPDVAPCNSSVTLLYDHFCSLLPRFDWIGVLGVFLLVKKHGCDSVFDAEVTPSAVGQLQFYFCIDHISYFFRLDCIFPLNGMTICYLSFECYIPPWLLLFRRFRRLPNSCQFPVLILRAVLFCWSLEQSRINSSSELDQRHFTCYVRKYVNLTCYVVSCHNTIWCCGMHCALYI